MKWLQQKIRERRFLLEDFTPPCQTTGNFQPEKRECPEQKTQKTCSFFNVDLNRTYSENLYFIAGIYCLHGKLTVVWNFISVELAEVKLAMKWFHFGWTHVDVNNEVTLHRSDILHRSEISNRYKFTSSLM